MLLSRIFIGTLLTTGFVISARHRRRANTSSPPVSWEKEGAPMIAALRGAGLMLWGSLALHVVWPMPLGPTYLPVPWWLRAGAALCALLLLPALVWMFRALGDNITPTVELRPEHELVTTGPYRYIRHPLYTFGMGLFGCLGVVAGSWWIMGWALIGAALLRVRLVREEAELEARFGDAYRDWASRTPRFLPRI